MSEQGFRVVPVEETYTPEALTLLLEHSDWDLHRLESECAARGIVVLLAPAPVAIVSPEQAERLYGAVFGETVRENIARSAPVVFVRVPITELPSSSSTQAAEARDQAR